MLNNVIKLFHINKECFLEEIEENGFRLAFGISIIIVGIVSYFYDTSNTILVGISISSFLFALFDATSKGNSLTYIIPLSILLLFCIFPDLPFIKFLLDEHLNNSIVFISFGLTFCIFSYSSYKNRIERITNKLEEDIRYRDNVINQYENSIIISKLVVQIRKHCIDKKYIDVNLHKLLSELEKYADEESTLGSIKNKLLSLSEDSSQNTYTIEEIENAVIEAAKYKRNVIIESANNKKFKK
ncbi:MAG: hypothetical protein Q4E69_07385 [Bacilli bacterium]|nr:hypothetical protein [Bacilli bacterium]